MRVAIIHPWFPQYRIGFFEELVRRGKEEGIEIRIFHGDPPPEWKERNDTGVSDGFTRLPTRFFKIRGRTLNWKSLAQYRAQGPFALVIVEQAVRNLESYALMFRGAPLAYWGHGKTYTLEVSAGQERLKQLITGSGRWFFAYTPGGVDAVVSAGFSRSRTTVVQNSIDTGALRDEIRSVPEKNLTAFAAQYDLRGKTALFVGGLDSSKRLGFLLDAAEHAYARDAEFRLLIAGAGAERNLIEKRAADLPYATYLGPLFGAEKALAIRAAQVMAMPGRVGLIAVDSFAGGTPIVTTNWAWHAPEFEYLESGLNAVVTEDNVMGFADGLIDTLQDTKRLEALQEACFAASLTYTVEAMVENFLAGLKSALARNE